MDLALADLWTAVSGFYTDNTAVATGVTVGLILLVVSRVYGLFLSRRR